MCDNKAGTLDIFLNKLCSKCWYCYYIKEMAEFWIMNYEVWIFKWKVKILGYNDIHWQKTAKKWKILPEFEIDSACTCKQMTPTFKSNFNQNWVQMVPRDQW